MKTFLLLIVLLFSCATAAIYAADSTSVINSGTSKSDTAHVGKKPKSKSISKETSIESSIKKQQQIIESAREKIKKSENDIRQAKIEIKKLNSEMMKKKRTSSKDLSNHNRRSRNFSYKSDKMDMMKSHKSKSNDVDKLKDEINSLKKEMKELKEELKNK